MSSKLLVSIFSDVIGPVMRGPSSSHCAAAPRMGRLARDLMGGQFTEVLVEFDRNGSLPITQDIAGTPYDDRVLGHQCGQFNDLMKAGRLLDGGALNRIILYVTALGGLSITPRSLAIEQRLGAKKAASCGSGCACC